MTDLNKCEQDRFKYHVGHDLNLRHPRSYNEKIACKKLFDRNPLLPLTTDKYRMRSFVRSVLGYAAEEHFIPQLWVGKKAKDIPFNHLPDTYIIKPNNAAGRELIKRDIGFTVDKHPTKRTLTIDDHIRVCSRWFHSLHGSYGQEWAYSQIDPLIIVEKLITVKGGEGLIDCKFFVFHGECKVAQVLGVGESYTFVFYDMEWNRLDARRADSARGKDVTKPIMFDELASIACKLGSFFDAVRIDFLVANDRYYIGEITHYPGAGYGKFLPTEFDYTLGSYWDMKNVLH